MSSHTCARDQAGVGRLRLEHVAQPRLDFVHDGEERRVQVACSAICLSVDCGVLN